MPTLRFPGSEFQAAIIHRAVGGIVDKETVLDHGSASQVVTEQIQRGAGQGHAIVAKNAVANDHVPIAESTVLDGNSSAARTRVIIGDLEAHERGVGAAEDLHTAPIVVEVGRALEGRIRNAFDRGAFRRCEVVRAGDLEALDDRGLAEPISAVNDVIYNGRKTLGIAFCYLGVCGGQRHVSHRLEMDSVVASVEPNQGLPRFGWSVGPGVNEYDLRLRLCSLIQSGLEIVAGRYVDGGELRGGW